MKILITGICGFVGSALAGMLAEDHDLVVCGIDNLSRAGSELNRAKLQERGVKVFHGDIRNGSDFSTMPAVDWVIDAAANPSVLAGIDGKTDSLQLIEHNLFGSVNVLELCKKHRAGCIILSTSRVYSIKALIDLDLEVCGRSFCLKKGAKLPPGLTARGISEEFSTLPPISLYGSAKLALEKLALEYGEAFGFPVWVNRCGILAGAGQFGKSDQGIISYWINGYVRRIPLSYKGFGGNGYQVRDVLHPRDLAALLRKQIAADANSAHAKVINLGGGPSNAVSLAELTAWCTSRFGPHPISSDTQTRFFDLPWIVMDYSLAENTWGWTPQMTLNQILDEIAEHAEKNPDWLRISGAL